MSKPSACSLALILVCVSSAFADEDADLEALALAVDNYAVPSAEDDLTPALQAVLERGSEEAAQGIVRSVRRAKSLLVALDADQIRLRQAVRDGRRRGVKLPRRAKLPADAHAEYARRLPELTEKKIQIQAKQRDRLAAMHAALLAAVRRVRGEEATAFLADLLDDHERDRDLRDAIVGALIGARSLRVVPVLIERLDTKDDARRLRASAELAQLTGADAGDLHKGWKRWWSRNKRRLMKENSK